MDEAALTARVREICLPLPGTTERLSHGSPAFFAKRQYVMLWPTGHHDRSFPHLWAAAAPGEQDLLVGDAPSRFFVPPYVGGRGWVGLLLVGEVDWAEVAEICTEAYRVITST